MARGGLANLKSVHQKKIHGANYIKNIHALGFIVNVQAGDTSDFLGIEASTYTNRGELWDGTDPQNQSVHAGDLIQSPGFITGLQEQDDTLLPGVEGAEFQDGTSKFGFGGVNDNNPQNWWGENYAHGFTELGPVEAGNQYVTQFVGITDTDYENPIDDIFQGLIAQQAGLDFDSMIPGASTGADNNRYMTGFTSYRAPGTGEIFNSVSEFINAVSIAADVRGTFNNPGQSLGLHYYTNYNDDYTIDHIDPELNMYMTGFTTNRIHKSPSEFQGITPGMDTQARGTYINPNNLIAEDLAGQIQIGQDFTSNPHFSSQEGPSPAYAKGFTPFFKRDKYDFGIDSEFHQVVPFSGGEGTELKSLVLDEDLEFTPYFQDNEINLDASVFIQGASEYGFIKDIGGTPTTNITLEDIYNEKIDDLIDWENVKSRTDGGLDLRAHNEVGGLIPTGFLPLTFSRTSILGKEPYIIKPIPNPRTGIGTDKYGILEASLDDAIRLTKYITSADGVKFWGGQNIIGLAANFAHNTLGPGPRIGNEPGDSGNRTYSKFFTDLAGGHQQFQYLYNPLSIFSSSIPYIKVRMNRSFLLDDDKYTERSSKSNAFLGQNKNTRLAQKLNAPDNVRAEKYNKDIVGPFSTPDNSNRRSKHTTLGGSLTNNVNTSIDGTGINVEGITGDEYTLTSIDTMENINKNDFPDEDFEVIEKGYPFYFKDMRNNKILAFRGFIEDINENVNANWGESQYIGRSEPVYHYQNSTRDLNFTFKLFPNNVRELDKIYEKINYLTGMLYPEYFEDTAIGYTRPKPPLCRLRLADLYGGKTANGQAEYSKGQMGFIQSLNYTYDGPWESMLGAGNRVPKYIIVNVSFKIINDKVPQLGTTFYGYKAPTEA